MMACCSLKTGVSISGFQETIFKPKLTHNNNSGLSCQFMGKSLIISDHKKISLSSSPNYSIKAQATHCISKAMRWWEKTLNPNMVEINSAQHFVDELQNAGDKLVIVDFYSPGCGGCKSLHPKICQLAESNPDAVFLKVNYEDLKPMCHALHIHVLPFFRFYKGAEGRVCSFSCTIATIKKFKDALAKHDPAKYASLGPAKGLEESEMEKLASIGQLSRKSPLSTSSNKGLLEELILEKMDNMSNALNVTQNNAMLVS